MPNPIKVGVITEAGGAHLGAYFPALAEAKDAASVAQLSPTFPTTRDAHAGVSFKDALLLFAPDLSVLNQRGQE